MDRSKAERSLVSVLRDGVHCGMGVFNSNDRVVTTAHCMGDTLLAVGTIVKISRLNGPSVSVEMVVEWYDEDFMFDIVILKPSPNSIETFTEFKKHLQFAPLQYEMYKPKQKFKVHVFRHDLGWASGMSQFTEDDDGLGSGSQTLSDMLEIENNPVIEVHQGTSGSPVFDDTGAVVGIMHFSASDPIAVGALTGGGETIPPVFTPFGPIIDVIREFIPPSA